MSPAIPARSAPSARVPEFLLQLLLCGFALHQLAVCVSHYLAFRFYLNDVGQLDYILYLTWQGKFFWSIIYDCPHFAKHCTPTLLLLVPLRALIPHVLLVPLLETLALISGAWAVSWMTDGVLRRGRSFPAPSSRVPGLALGLLYLGSPLTGAMMLSYHFESFAVALTLWALAAWVQRRRKLFWVLFLLALGCKEDVALYWIAFALWWIVRGGTLRRSHWRERFKPGLALLALALGWLLLALLSIRWTAQHYGQPVSEYAYRYRYLGGTVREIAGSFIAYPWLWIAAPLRVATLALWTVLLLPLLAPSTLLLLLPGAYLFGLSQEESQYYFYYYYRATLKIRFLD